MLIEIRGVGTHNKGAELMLQVILDQVRRVAPETKFAVERWFGLYEDRARYQLRSILPSKSGYRSRFISCLSSKSYRETYGLVSPSDIDAVIDASGFAFGDQWGIGSLKHLAEKAETWRKSRVPTVFLPQAWGPFSTPTAKYWARKSIDQLDLVFAREATSTRHLSQLKHVNKNVFQAHDFTNLIVGKAPVDLKLPNEFACIVPNIRMLDKTDPRRSNAYLGFLSDSIRRLQSERITPLYLFHERKQDQVIADQVRERTGIELPTISLTCPSELKGVLGKSHVVVGSRFHALVGALCQGVPVIATSWSHKYEELLAEYGVPELIVDPAEPNHVATAIDSVLTNHDLLRQRIDIHSDEFKKQSKNTFKLCFETVGLN